MLAESAQANGACSDLDTSSTDPFFGAVYNTLNEKLPQYDDLGPRLLRSAVIGFSASAVSDTCSNSIRVIKTTKQTHSESVTYPQVLKASVLWLLTHPRR